MFEPWSEKTNLWSGQYPASFEASVRRSRSNCRIGNFYVTATVWRKRTTSEDTHICHS